MARFRRDLDDEDLLDHREIEERKATRAERHAEAERQGRDRAAEDAAIAARSAKFTEETNARARIAEYRAAGVEPLKVNDRGVPTCTLAVLLRIGWTIQDTPAGKKLVEPPPYVPPKRPPQECS